MAAAVDLLIGEFVRTLDERFRLAIPPELLEPLLAAGPKLVLAKERAGCLSLWSASLWKPRLDAAVDVVRSKLEAGLLAQRLGQVQELGRLLSTRQQTVSLAGRALAEGRWNLATLQLRDFATDKHRTVDDTPFGGGQDRGHVLRKDRAG